MAGQEDQNKCTGKETGFPRDYVYKRWPWEAIDAKATDQDGQSKTDVKEAGKD